MININKKITVIKKFELDHFNQSLQLGNFNPILSTYCQMY
jgi:hypothetical protein